MIASLIYIVFAALGIGFLIFIHELGHYLMAKKVGMKVETFSIGFGRSIYEWKVGDEVWKIGWLPFGGYVRIAGMDMSDDNKVESPDSFFAKSPWDRIKVAFMGPFVNLVFAFLAFTLIWMLGGREKNFSEFTSKIGWVDPQSELFVEGIRPGDEITAYDDRPFTGLKDHIYAPMVADETLNVKGNMLNPYKKEKIPFELDVHTYTHPLALDDGRLTSGVLFPASYVIYSGKGATLYDNPKNEGAPLYDSGIEEGDRIVWVDGERIFSLYQLSRILNDNKILLTVERGDETFLRRVPRVEVEDLKLTAITKEEFIDWQHETGMTGKRIGKLLTIPYDMNAYGVIEGRYPFIDSEVEDKVFSGDYFSELEKPLLPGDRIVAIHGKPVNYAYQVFAQTQERTANIIVQRDEEVLTSVASDLANEQFDWDVNQTDIDALASKIGTSRGGETSGNLILLKPVTPRQRSSFTLPPEKQALLAAELQEEKNLVESIDDPDKRARAQQLIEERDQQLILGLPQGDRRVVYNPNPIEQFYLVYDEIWRTLVALVTGNLNPKWLAGPIGMVQIVQSSWGVSINEVLFWLGAISLNLGFLNLLPIPVLDGGYICIFLYEMVTKRRMQKKTMEKLIIPFVVLLVGLLFYTTYQDISRLVGGLFRF